MTKMTSVEKTFGGVKIKLYPSNCGKDPDETNYWIPASQVAKLIRAQLKTRFPKTNFRVVTRHGGIVNVSWVNGPTSGQVDAVVDSYETAHFDGSIDLGYSSDKWLLPDGRMITACNPGSEGSGGMNRRQENKKPGPDAIKVYGHIWVFSSRGFTKDYLLAFLDSAKLPLDQRPNIIEQSDGQAWLERDKDNVKDYWLMRYLAEFTMEN